jgi:hypothetical protein
MNKEIVFLYISYEVGLPSLKTGLKDHHKGREIYVLKLGSEE